MGLLRFVSRALYYFRIGYGSYLTFLLGYATTLITVYYLAIKNIPYLLNLFPNFVPFVILATVVGVPFSVMVGWWHLKRSQMAASEQWVSVEMNPLTYALPESGIATDVLYPSLALLLQVVQRLGEEKLTPKEKQLFKDLSDRYETLFKGGYVGNPRTSSLPKRKPEPK